MTTPSSPGPKILLMGASGSGKTFSIRSLVEAGIETFVIATEPGIANVLGDVSAEKLHWHYLPPMPLSLDTLADQILKINSMSFEALTKMTASRSEFRQMLDFMGLLKNFKCQRTGREFGDVTKFTNGQALVVDSLTGLTMMMVNATIGSKPVMNQPEYGLVQTALERTINSLCMTLPCAFVLTAHVEREFDEVSGAVSLMASTAGKKLAPKLPRFFDEVVLAKREGAAFLWSTASSGVDTKARLLPIGERLSPSFKPLVDAWRAKTKG